MSPRRWTGFEKGQRGKGAKGRRGEGAKGQRGKGEEGQRGRKRKYRISNIECRMSKEVCGSSSFFPSTFDIRYSIFDISFRRLLPLCPFAPPPLRPFAPSPLCPFFTPHS
ncbi:MAG: hypothetical protein EHM23_21830 [Acidobacteria bacterium]|nr:MAG: hypothetical protein EHM23_21830 [Acidobacteriota bacterium]